MWNLWKNAEKGAGTWDRGCVPRVKPSEELLLAEQGVRCVCV
jgi:hypothetical protein